MPEPTHPPAGRAPARPQETPPADTRERLLAAAERLFAEEGIDASSTRRITTEAGANLAAVNYHFGSKDGLVREVLRSRFEGVNAARLQALDALEAAPGEPELEAILRAFLAPAFEQLGAGSGHFLCLMARLHHSPHPVAVAYLEELLAPLARRFLAALGRALPEVPPERLFLRTHFMIGAMVQALSLLAPETGGPLQCSREHADALRERLSDPSALVDELVLSCAASFRP